jgi:GNAT superfamily N-acetyltransferase
METQTRMSAEAVGRCDFDLHRAVTPLEADPARQVESFLRQIFECGDYSFRPALHGTYSEALGCTFFLACSNGRLIGATASLYARDMPTVALVGPVAVTPDYQRMGVATAMLHQLMADFRQGLFSTMYAPPCLRGQLAEAKEWFITTPSAVVTADGVVQTAWEQAVPDLGAMMAEVAQSEQNNAYSPDFVSTPISTYALRKRKEVVRNVTASIVTRLTGQRVADRVSL